MRVKICGLTRPADAEAAAAAGADMLGFIFVPNTPRYLDPATASWVRNLAADTVGVFRDTPLAEITGIREQLRLDWVQLHGDEPDDLIEALGPRVIRRVVPTPNVDWQRIAWLSERCLVLLDPGAGDGRTCDWTTLARAPSDIEFALAGGLDPDNVVRAIATASPTLVDVSSGVESNPGIKDHDLVRAFVERARAGTKRCVVRQ